MSDNNSQTYKLNKIIAFDYIRVFAAYTVIVLHAVAGPFIGYFNSEEWNIANFYESIVRWNVPIFIMISGALFLNKNKKLSITRLYTKNILRIIIVLLGWSIIYAIPTILKGHNLNYIFGAIIGGPYQFWFLRVLVGLYIAIPIYKIIATNRKIELYFLIIAFIIGILVPSCFSIIKLINPSVYENLSNIYKSLELNIATTYSFYFVLGHYLITYPIKYRKLFYLLGSISFISVFLLTHITSHKIGRPVEIFYSNSCLFTMLEAAAIYIFFINCKLKNNIIVDNLSKCSFSIYIIHIFVMIGFSKLGIQSFSFYPLLSVPIYSILVFTVSFIIATILQKIPIVNKWLM